jgi:hypothetical protein
VAESDWVVGVPGEAPSLAEGRTTCVVRGVMFGGASGCWK